MANRRRMYLASEAGLVELVEAGGCWVHERTSFEGKGRASSYTPALYAVVALPETGVLYAGVAQDGVYTSKDGGRSWDRVFEADVRSIAVDPSDPRTVYAGTEPVHLYRSQDGGATWVELEGLQRVPQEVRDTWNFPLPPHDAHVLCISVDPRNRNRVYIALEQGGILRTDDGGQTWEDVSVGLASTDMHMVAPDPARENVVYCTSLGGFHRSEEYGRNWKRIPLPGRPAGEYTHEFAFCPGPRTTIVMTTANGGPRHWQRESHAESAIYRSEDGGLSWQQLGGGLPAYMERMIWSVIADPLDGSRLYACTGEYPLFLKEGCAGGDVWASADRGDTWARVYEGLSPIQKIAVTVS